LSRPFACRKISQSYHHFERKNFENHQQKQAKIRFYAAQPVLNLKISISKKVVFELLK
jgi:hypothetical protein